MFKDIIFIILLIYGMRICNNPAVAFFKDFSVEVFGDQVSVENRPFKWQSRVYRYWYTCVIR